MKNGGLVLEVVDRSTFIFYFEEEIEHASVLHRGLWSFDDGLIAMKRLLLDAVEMEAPETGHVQDDFERTLADLAE